MIAHLVHLHEPLLGQDRLDDRLAPLADRQRDLVILDLFEQAELFESLDDLFPRFETVQAFEIRHRPPHSSCVVVHHEQLFEVVPLADLIIVRIVSRRDLDGTGAKFRVDIFVGDDRNLAVRQRQMRSSCR